MPSSSSIGSHGPANMKPGSRGGGMTPISVSMVICARQPDCEHTVRAPAEASHHTARRPGPGPNVPHLVASAPILAPPLLHRSEDERASLTTPHAPTSTPTCQEQNKNIFAQE